MPQNSPNTSVQQKCIKCWLNYTINFKNYTAALMGERVKETYKT